MNNNNLISPEWMRLIIIGLLSVIAILPGAHYLMYQNIPDYWLSENGLYETAGAAACFMAAMLYLASYKLWSDKMESLRSFWMIMFAIGCFFIAGEEISWGQHLFDYNLPDSITNANFQREFNLHNSRLIQDSNNSLSAIFFKLLMFYFVVLPMFLVVFPTFARWINKAMIPVPSLFIASIGLITIVGHMVNLKIVIGYSANFHALHLGEEAESIFEICLLIFALESFLYAKRKIVGCQNKLNNEKKG